MRPQTTLTKVLSAFALVTVLSLSASGSAHAAPRACAGCGMFGLARNQVARINVVHIGGRNQRPIHVEMLFLDPTDAIVGRDVQTITPGQAVFFDLLFDGHDENRIELRALVNAINPPDGDKNLSMTVEIFDANTGKTTVLIGD